MQRATQNYGADLVGSAPAVRSSQRLSGQSLILGIPGLFPSLPMDATSHRAVAEVLGNYHYNDAALARCRTALAATPTPLEEFKILILLANTQLAVERAAEAAETIAQCLLLASAEGVTPALRRAALVCRARIAASQSDTATAMQAYREAKEVDPAGVTLGADLSEEAEIPLAAGDHAGFVACLRGWKPIERLTWLTWRYDTENDERSLRLLDAAARAGEADFLVAVYEESIRYLDGVGAGAPLRVDLAWVHRMVRGDLAAARRVLDDVLDSGSNGWAYDLTDEQPDATLERALNAQSECLFALFQRETNPGAKAELLAAVRGLTQRPLALDVPPNSATFLLHHRILTARMALKMGPREEFQRGLQGAIDTCISALEDDVGWNDLFNLSLLTEALATLAGALPDKNGPAAEALRRAAGLVLSAQFSKLTAEPEKTKGEDGGDGTDEDDSDGADDSDEDSEDDSEDDSDDDSDDSDDDDSDDDEKLGPPPTDEGDLSLLGPVFCDGICNPIKTFKWWGGHSGYQCVSGCDQVFFCEECFDALQADKSGQKPLPGRRFCDRSHEHYIKAPVDGWKGVKDGVMTFEGGRSVSFAGFLKSIQEEICKKAWEEFWTGG